MFENDALHERGRALEDEFFHRVDEELRAKLRESMEREKSREQLRAATGFKDEQLIEHLLDSGIDVSKLAALAILPAVFVAWADGSVTPQERQTILSDALHRGIDREPSAFQLIDVWLTTRPPRSLWKLWKEYAQAFITALPHDYATTVAAEIQHQATAVAQASRQSVEFRKISTQERALLDEIAATFHLEKK